MERDFIYYDEPEVVDVLCDLMGYNPASLSHDVVDVWHTFKGHRLEYISVWVPEDTPNKMMAVWNMAEEQFRKRGIDIYVISKFAVFLYCSNKRLTKAEHSLHLKNMRQFSSSDFYFAARFETGTGLKYSFLIASDPKPSKYQINSDELLERMYVHNHQW